MASGVEGTYWLASIQFTGLHTVCKYTAARLGRTRTRVIRGKRQFKKMCLVVSHAQQSLDIAHRVILYNIATAYGAYTIDIGCIISPTITHVYNAHASYEFTVERLLQYTFCTVHTRRRTRPWYSYIYDMCIFNTAIIESLHTERSTLSTRTKTSGDGEKSRVKLICEQFERINTAGVLLS